MAVLDHLTACQAVAHQEVVVQVVHRAAAVADLQAEAHLVVALPVAGLLEAAALEDLQVVYQVVACLEAVYPEAAYPADRLVVLVGNPEERMAARKAVAKTAAQTVMETALLTVPGVFPAAYLGPAAAVEQVAAAEQAITKDQVVAAALAVARMNPVGMKTVIRPAMAVAGKPVMKSHPRMTAVAADQVDLAETVPDPVVMDLAATKN